MQSLANATIHFNDQGTPVATNFDDIYFSNDGGLAETDYVFLQQNRLPERWATHQKTFFHILETGFGTGANFLLSWHRFRQHLASHPDASCQRLYFTSFEKYPLSASDLEQALAVHTALQVQCAQLLAAYPPPIPGCFRLVFDDGSVVLDLWQGDVNTLLSQVPQQNKVDAIFLDGFAPAKNPDMWQPTLFQQLHRLSHEHTTLATFTCAGVVKRGLQDAGFTIQKVKGFGKKREMLIANASAAPTPVIEVGPVTIIGGGIAALCAALTLVERGVAVTLLCADAAVAQGASHNRQGALYPNLPVTLTANGAWHCHAFYFARQFYQRCRERGLDFPLAYTGLLHLASTPQLAERQRKTAEQKCWPDTLVRFVDATTASELAGIPLTQSASYIPQAGWLGPQAFCQELYRHLTQHPLFTAKFHCRVSAITPSASGWQLTTPHDTLQSLAVLVATGAELNTLLPLQHLPINRVRGQVSHIKAPQLAALNTLICHKGYLTPAWQGLHCIGATFDRDATQAVVKAVDDEINVAELRTQCADASWAEDIQVVSAKAAFRATVPDHLPVAGSVQHAAGLWVLGGLGARGLLFAPLLAEVVACQLTAHPIPVAESMLALTAADRFKPS